MSKTRLALVSCVVLSCFALAHAIPQKGALTSVPSGQTDHRLKPSDCIKSGLGTHPTIETYVTEDGTLITVQGRELDPVMHARNVPCSDPIWLSPVTPTHDLVVYNSSELDIKVHLSVLPTQGGEEGLFGGFRFPLRSNDVLKIEGVAVKRIVHIEIYEVNANELAGAIAEINYDCDARRRQINGKAWEPYQLTDGRTALRLGLTVKE